MHVWLCQCTKPPPRRGLDWPLGSFMYERPPIADHNWHAFVRLPTLVGEMRKIVGKIIDPKLGILGTL